MGLGQAFLIWQLFQLVLGVAIIMLMFTGAVCSGGFNCFMSNACSLGTNVH